MTVSFRTYTYVSAPEWRLPRDSVWGRLSVFIIHFIIPFPEGGG